MKETVRLTVNEKPVELKGEGDRKLLWILRSDLGLTGTKYGCGRGLCGACTVLVDGQAVRSCRVPVGKLEGKAITTIEGLARPGKLHPLQRAFVEHGALQCGFCTPGMILNAHALLRANARPTREEIVRGMDGNLCRCGAHTRILRAIETAAGAPKGARR